ncbi:TPA: TPR and ankyrin repeat-containing protein 1 [Trebouxia sp. C0004]
MNSDHLALASTWRNAKLQEFEQRVVGLGLSETPVGAALLQRLQAETCAVQTLQKQQSQQADAGPWWADGEYDDDAAERANDTGTEFFGRQDYCAAFTHYTEAIRLCPRKATFHCNRAAAALKLQRFSIAATDARQAIKRDSQNIKAYLRAGQAQAGLKKPEEAARWFRRALLLDKTSSAAQRGLDTTKRAQGRAHAAALQEQAGAGRGDRPGLSRQPLEAEEAAQMLHSSEGMLKAQPASHAVQCSHAEALIACRRYPDALKSISLLQPGVDKLYLQAEGQWRQADLAAAHAALSEASQQAVSSSKCAGLQLWVQSLQHRMHAAEIACEDGMVLHICAQQQDHMLRHGVWHHSVATLLRSQI